MELNLLFPTKLYKMTDFQALFVKNVGCLI